MHGPLSRSSPNNSNFEKVGKVCSKHLRHPKLQHHEKTDAGQAAATPKDRSIMPCCSRWVFDTLVSDRLAVAPSMLVGRAGENVQYILGGESVTRI